MISFLQILPNQKLQGTVFGGPTLFSENVKRTFVIYTFGLIPSVLRITLTYAPSVVRANHTGYLTH